MNRLCTALATLATVLAVSGRLAHAAPPTVVPSPGYDARLEEQRRAARSPVVQPTVSRRHHRKQAH